MLKYMTVSSLVEYIEDNIETKFIKIEDLTQYSGYSRRHLQTTFKEYIGIPIGRYIRMRRASRAAALLRLTKLPVIEISDRFFYDSQQTFTREFKKLFGYTPRQYRVNPFWSFNNLLGRRDINTIYPEPKICYLKERKIIGKRFDFDEVIIYSGVNSKTRWGRFYNSIKNDTFVTVSNRIPFHVNTNGKTIARTVVWADREQSNCEIIIDSGLYAHFSFSSTLDDYPNYLYNIYYNSLPLFNLNKKDSYDVEIIKKRSNGILDCHYYLPIHC